MVKNQTNILSASALFSCHKGNKTLANKWLPSIILLLSIISLPSMAEKEAAKEPLAIGYPHFNSALLAMTKTNSPPLTAPEPFAEQATMHSKPSQSPPKGENLHWHARIEFALKNHWKPSPNDPANMAKDLAEMAAYFSRFPEVRLLIASIEHKKWQLHYAVATYETKIQGNHLNIDSVTVLFDSRSAAQFKFYRACTDKKPFCVASPADVLLHELLHVQAVVNDPDSFIAQGGMNGVMYPYEHERQTILAEKQLYQSMSAIDGHPRPLRSEHTGRHVLASCVTCLQIK